MRGSNVGRFQVFFAQNLNFQVPKERFILGSIVKNLFLGAFGLNYANALLNWLDIIPPIAEVFDFMC